MSASHGACLDVTSPRCVTRLPGGLERNVSFLAATCWCEPLCHASTNFGCQPRKKKRTKTTKGESEAFCRSSSTSARRRLDKWGGGQTPFAYAYAYAYAYPSASCLFDDNLTICSLR